MTGRLRDRRGEPHVGTRALALVLVLLLAGPLTVFLWRVGSYLWHAVVV